MEPQSPDVLSPFTLHLGASRHGGFCETRQIANGGLAVPDSQRASCILHASQVTFACLFETNPVQCASYF